MAKNSGKILACPFLSGPCQTVRCQIYDPKLNNCTIKVLAYNLYRLSEVESQRLMQSSSNEEEPTTPVNQSVPMRNVDLEDFLG